MKNTDKKLNDEQTSDFRSSEDLDDKSLIVDALVQLYGIRPEETKRGYDRRLVPTYQAKYGPAMGIIKVELPGVKKSDISVKVREGLMLITARRYENWIDEIQRKLNKATQTIKDEEPKKNRFDWWYVVEVPLSRRADGGRMIFKSFEAGVLTLMVPNRQDWDKLHTVSIEQ